MDAIYQDVKRFLTLEQVVRAEIRGGGPITFARFMELALYHDSLGYYPAHRNATTRSGDYLTAPETHSVFGVLLARFAHAEALSSESSDFTVVEQGAGTGALAEAFVDGWRLEWPDAPMRYVIVEPHVPAHERLRRRLGDRVDVVATIVEAAPFTGVYLSNELPDAFPVHRVRLVDGTLVEIFVALEGEQLIEEIGPPSTSELQEYLDFVALRLDEGAEIEVNLGIGPWLCGVSDALDRGTVLTIDYGYDAHEASRFPRGTLLAHYRHAANEDFLRRVGMQDLTAHVCWTAIERFGAQAGLLHEERITQREFLMRWGWKEFGRRLLDQPNTTRAELDAVDRLGRLQNGLGGLGVLIQRMRANELR